VIARPDMSPQGERLAERTGPMAVDDEARDWAHAILCGALGEVLEQVGEIADPEDPYPPMAPLLSAELCPAWALPWLAQFVGVSIPVGATEQQARDIVTDVAGFKRGTPAAMRAAAGLFLTGEKTVFFRERDGSPYRIEVVTLTSETPDPAKVLNALLLQKPGGLVLSFRQVEGWDYQELESGGPDPYSTLATTYLTYSKLRENTPG
jgi:hypothetical protein